MDTWALGETNYQDPGRRDHSIVNIHHILDYVILCYIPLYCIMVYYIVLYDIMLYCFV